MLRQRRLLVALLVLCTVVAAWPLPVSAQESELRTGFRLDAPPYAIRGPYPVGAVDYVIAIESLSVAGTIWFPAVNPAGEPEYIQYDLGISDLVPDELATYPGRAIRNATPDISGGPYPLVVWSSSFGSHRFAEYYLLEHLASHGFVVSSVNHPGNSLRETMLVRASDESLMEQYLENCALGLVLRPLEMRLQINYALQHKKLAGLVDPDRIVVAGRNFGGIAALLTVGGQLDLGMFTAACDDAPEHSVCRLASEYLQSISVLLDGQGLSDTIWAGTYEPRIKAVVVVSPGTMDVLPVRTEIVTVPLLLVQGTNDRVVRAEQQRALVYDTVASADKALVVLEGASDWAASICPEIWHIGPWHEMCTDPVWDSYRVYDLLDHFVLAFLRATLDGDPEAAAALAPEAVTFPGIRYETTMTD